MANRIWQYQGKGEPVLVPEVTLDKWFQSTAVPIFPVKGFDQNISYLFVFDPDIFAEVIALDKWYQPTSQPIFSVKGVIEQPISVGIFESTLFIVPTMDSWFKEISQPVLLVKQPDPTVIGGFIGEPTDFLPPETITLDKWWQPISQPIFLKQPITPEFLVGILEPTLFVIPSLDSWFSEIEQPVLLDKLNPVVQDNFIFDLALFAEVITLDKWWQPTSQPVFPLKQLIPDIQVGILESTLFVIPSLDSWFSEISQPLLVGLDVDPTLQNSFQFDPDTFVEPTPEAPSSVVIDVGLTPYQALFKILNDGFN